MTKPMQLPHSRVQPSPSTATTNHTDTLGIISIILAFLSLGIPGFIVGLIGASKAKKTGTSPTLSRIGWIISLVEIILVTIALIIGLLVFVTTETNKKTGLSSSSTKSGKIVRGDTFSLQVPTDYEDLSSKGGNFAEAEVAYGNNDVWVIAYFEPREDLAETVNATNYADAAYNGFKTDATFTSQTRTPLAVGTIQNPHDYQVADYTMSASEGVLRHIYYDRYVCTNRGCYMVTIWTSPSSLSEHKQEMIDVLASFEETPAQ